MVAYASAFRILPLRCWLYRRALTFPHTHTALPPYHCTVATRLRLRLWFAACVHAPGLLLHLPHTGWVTLPVAFALPVRTTFYRTTGYACLRLPPLPTHTLYGYLPTVPFLYRYVLRLTLYLLPTFTVGSGSHGLHGLPRGYAHSLLLLPTYGWLVRRSRTPHFAAVVTPTAATTPAVLPGSYTVGSRAHICLHVARSHTWTHGSVCGYHSARFTPCALLCGSPHHRLPGCYRYTHTQLPRLLPRFTPHTLRSTGSGSRTATRMPAVVTGYTHTFGCYTPLPVAATPFLCTFAVVPLTVTALVTWFTLLHARLYPRVDRIYCVFLPRFCVLPLHCRITCGYLPRLVAVTAPAGYTLPALDCVYTTVAVAWFGSVTTYAVCGSHGCLPGRCVLTRLRCRLRVRLQLPPLVRYAARTYPYLRTGYLYRRYRFTVACPHAFCVPAPPYRHRLVLTRSYRYTFCRTPRSTHRYALHYRTRGSGLRAFILLRSAHLPLRLVAWLRLRCGSLLVGSLRTPRTHTTLRFLRLPTCGCTAPGSRARGCHCLATGCWFCGLVAHGSCYTTPHAHLRLVTRLPRVHLPLYALPFLQFCLWFTFGYLYTFPDYCGFLRLPFAVYAPHTFAYIRRTLRVPFRFPTTFIPHTVTVEHTHAVWLLRTQLHLYAITPATRGCRLLVAHTDSILIQLIYCSLLLRLPVGSVRLRTRFDFFYAVYVLRLRLQFAFTVGSHTLVVLHIAMVTVTPFVRLYAHWFTRCAHARLFWLFILRFCSLPTYRFRFLRLRG